MVVCVALDRAGRFPPLEAEGLCHLREADAENWIQPSRTAHRHLDHPIPLSVRAHARILTRARLFEVDPPFLSRSLQAMDLVASPLLLRQLIDPHEPISLQLGDGLETHEAAERS